MLSGSATLTGSATAVGTCFPGWPPKAKANADGGGWRPALAFFATPSFLGWYRGFLSERRQRILVYTLHLLELIHRTKRSTLLAVLDDRLGRTRRDTDRYQLLCVHFIDVGVFLAEPHGRDIQFPDLACNDSLTDLRLRFPFLGFGLAEAVLLYRFGPALDDLTLAALAVPLHGRLLLICGSGFTLVPLPFTRCSEN